MNSNIDFIVNYIDFQYNMDNKTFMQSSEIYIFIGAYQQLIAMLSLRINIFIGTWTFIRTCIILLFKNEVKSQPKTPFL